MVLQDDAVYIASAARTPHGTYRGSLSHFSATQLGSHAIKAALDRASKIPPEFVDELLVGNVLSANLGQNPAKQCAVGAELPSSVICTSVNKVCASGLKAVTLGSQSILSGHVATVIAAGTESMTNCPLYLRSNHATRSATGTAKKGSSLSSAPQKPVPPSIPVSGVVRDGLTDAYGPEEVMGFKAEQTAQRYGITREAQDSAAGESFRKMMAAYEAGWMEAEITCLTIKGHTEVLEVMKRDETLDKFPLTTLSSLKPAFDPAGGSVTAGNTASLSDGASAVVLVSGTRASELGVCPLARIVDWADAETDPQDFITAPSLAIKKLLAQSGTDLGAVDVFEINEAFAVSTLVNVAQLGIPPDKVNMAGGSLAIGHPLGSSGCRILVSLLTVMAAKGARLGCASICNGGGGATAILVELVRRV